MSLKQLLQTRTQHTRAWQDLGESRLRVGNFKLCVWWIFDRHYLCNCELQAIVQFCTTLASAVLYVELISRNQVDFEKR